jgi:dihydroxyacetone kinase
MTSLDALGFSITLLKATLEMITYLDAPAKAVGWAPPRRPQRSQSNLVANEPEKLHSVQEASSGIERELRVALYAPELQCREP